MEGLIASKGNLRPSFKPKPCNLNASSILIRTRNLQLQTNSTQFPPLKLQNSHNFAKKPQNLLYSQHGSLHHGQSRFICPATAAMVSSNNDHHSNKEKETKKFLGIEIHTLKKIVPLGLMFFCILFNYTIVRNTKDVLVVTAKGSSAEIIPFLKTWVTLPSAIGFMLIYTKLSDILTREALFYSMIFPFIAFFGTFAFVLYPLRDAIHPIGLADKLVAALGPSSVGPVAILRIWSFCLFYVMAELWGSVVLSLLFWGFANQIMTIEEAKKFYSFFGLGANVSLIFAGRTVRYFSNLRERLGPGIDGWEVSLKGMMSMVVIMGLIIIGIYWATNKFVLQDPTVPKPDHHHHHHYKKKKKAKQGIKESLRLLLSSKYLRDLATLVVSYGISINLIEVTWKSKLKAQFPSPNAYASFMGDFSTATGLTTLIMMLVGRQVLLKFGWGTAALVTPTVLLITGVGFFYLLLFGQTLTPLLSHFGMTPLLAAVYVGAMQNIFSKSAKYSLFDPCKEMAYIPLDEEMKFKGKAAIDVVGNPLGKSGGALIQQLMILVFGSLANSTPYLGGSLLVIVIAWLRAAYSLNLQFIKLEEEEEEEDHNNNDDNDDDNKNCVKENNIQKSSESLIIVDEAICAT